MVYDEVTFCEFQETKDSSQKLEDSSRKIVFLFFTPILSACIITSSLIHEAMTLMERLFKFWERHLSVQIAYLIEKGFLKARNTSYGSWLWKKRISKAQKVFEGFKDLGSISTIHQLFLIVIVEKVTYNLVNIKFRILLT